MQIVQVLAGFSLGEADILRRAMGHKQPELLMQKKEAFLAGTRKNGIDDELADKIFELLTHFANYGFNKSHSAAYALVAWQTAYLKAHYPAEFMAAMLTSIMDVNDKVGVYIELARRMGIPILPPDVNASAATFSVDGNAIRFGLAAVRNVGEQAIGEMEKIRAEGGPFLSMYDFCSRVGTKQVNKRTLESLVKCGAFDSFGARRAQLLEIVAPALEKASQAQKDSNSGQMGLFDEEELGDADIPLPDVPEAELSQILAWEKENTGFYITGHPLDVYKDLMGKLAPISRILDGEAKDRQLVRIAGLAAKVKRSSTKKGDTMAYLTLEDYTRDIEIVVFPRQFYDTANLLTADRPLVIQGRVDISDKGVKVIADRIWPMEDYRTEYFIVTKSAMATAKNKERLREAAKSHHGDHAVHLYITDWRRNTDLGQEYWMDGSPEAAAEVEKIFGAGSVRER